LGCREKGEDDVVINGSMTLWIWRNVSALQEGSGRHLPEPARPILC
jgi:hypothetical protein